MTVGSRVSGDEELALLLEYRLLITADRFDGEEDLEDLWVGKLSNEGGAPRLGHVAPDLLDLDLSSSPMMLADTPARLSLDPTVSTFALPYYKRVQSSSGDSDNDK